MTQSGPDPVLETTKAIPALPERCGPAIGNEPEDMLDVATTSLSIAFGDVRRG